MHLLLQWPQRHVFLVPFLERTCYPSSLTETGDSPLAARIEWESQFESRAEPTPRIRPANVSCTITTTRKFRGFAFSVLTFNSLEKAAPRSMLPTWVRLRATATCVRILPGVLSFPLTFDSSVSSANTSKTFADLEEAAGWHRARLDVHGKRIAFEMNRRQAYRNLFSLGRALNS